MYHLVEDIFIVRFSVDIINYIISFVLLIYILKKNNIKKKFSFIILVSSFFPLFFNYLLFDWTKFLDQSKYLFIAQSVRNLEFDIIKDVNISILLPGIIYSLFPIPFIYTFGATSIIARSFFLITIIFTFKKYYKDKSVLFFLLFCPSIILYSSIGLRETFLFSFLILFFFNLNKNKFFYALIFLLLFFLTKPEAGLMLIVSLSAYYLLFSNMSEFFKVILIYLCLLGCIVFNDEILNYINKRYSGFYHEEYLFSPNLYANYSDLIISLSNKFLEFIFSPLYEITNIFRFFQFFENLFIYLYLFFYFKHCYKFNKFKTLYWFIILFLNLVIYSLIVVNPGSIARYKILLFLVIILCLNHCTKKNV